mgnify:CR=1 FL=1
MEENENIKILRDSYRLWSERNPEAAHRWMELLDDKIQWRSLADGAPGMEFTSACDCKEGVAKYFEELGKNWDMIQYRVDEFIAQGDRVVALSNCEWKNKKTGKTVKSLKADVFRMKNSKIVEFFEFYDTAKAYNATV